MICAQSDEPSVLGMPTWKGQACSEEAGRVRKRGFTACLSVPLAGKLSTQGTYRQDCQSDSLFLGCMDRLVQVLLRGWGGGGGLCVCVCEHACVCVSMYVCVHMFMYVSFGYHHTWPSSPAVITHGLLNDSI